MLDNLDLYIELLQILNTKPATAQELLNHSTLAMDLNSVLNVLKDHIEGGRVSMKMGVYEITATGKNTILPVLHAKDEGYKNIDTFALPNDEITEKLVWTEQEDGTIELTNKNGAIVLNINEQEQLFEILKSLDLK